MKKQLGIAIIAAMFSCPAAWAQSDSTASARASMDISSGSAQVVMGSFRMVDASGQFLVTAIESTARGASIVLQGVSAASGAAWSARKRHAPPAARPIRAKDRVETMAGPH